MSACIEQESPGDDQAQAALWRQRLFEGHSAMSQYLTQQHQGTDLADWLAVSAQIFQELPPASAGAGAWQAVFFRCQALVEQFIVQRTPRYVLDHWALLTGQVYRALEPAGQGQPAVVADRLGRQAGLYGSRFVIKAAGAQSQVFAVAHCGIWDYRERARATGVPITLKSACTYCTKLLGALVQAKGCSAQWMLSSDAQGHSCQWLISPATSAGQGGSQHASDH